jgi:putative hemolysin
LFEIDRAMMQIFVLLGIISVNGFLALSEMALVSSRRTRLLKLMEDGSTRAKTALKLADSPTSFLASLQICITILGIAAGAWGGANLSRSVKQWFDQEVPTLVHYSESLSMGLVVAFETFFMVLIGELLPKRLALFFPERIALAVAPVIDTVGRVIAPASQVLSGLTDRFIAILPIKPKSADESHVTEDELKIMVTQGAEAGVFDKNEETFLKRALDFGDLTGQDMMTPRTKVVSFGGDRYIDDVIDEMLECGYSNFPVYAQRSENIVGMVSIKTALKHHRRSSQRLRLRDLLEPVLFMPDSAKAPNIMEKMKLGRKQMVILIDEFGGVAGLVSITDIMEAVVGEVLAVDTAPQFVKRSDGSWLVDGMASLQDLETETGYVIDDDENHGCQTVAGYVMHHLKSIPQEGQFVTLGSWTFEVVDMDRNRIDKILLTALQAVTSTGDSP